MPDEEQAPPPPPVPTTCPGGGHDEGMDGVSAQLVWRLCVAVMIGCSAGLLARALW